MPVLRKRLLEVLRPLRELNDMRQQGLPMDEHDESREVINERIRAQRAEFAYWAEKGVKPEDMPEDVSRSVRIVSMEEYRVEVGEEVWMDETFGEEVPPHPALPSGTA